MTHITLIEVGANRTKTAQSLLTSSNHYIRQAAEVLIHDHKGRWTFDSTGEYGTTFWKSPQGDRWIGVTGAGEIYE